jgi:hypothetical protein
MTTEEKHVAIWLRYCEEPPEGVEQKRVYLWLYWQCKNTPEEAWLVILKIVKHELTPRQSNSVGQGIKPLFYEHTDEFEQRIAELAASNSQFARALLSVDRYVKAQSEEWFAEQWISSENEENRVAKKREVDKENLYLLLVFLLARA